MSGVRWTTGIGIALGGVGGAVAALLGAPARPAAPAVTNAPVASVSSPAFAAPAPTVSAAPPLASAPEVLPATAGAPAATASPLAASTSPPTAVVSFTPAPLELPKTMEALLRAEVLCDRKKQYDECSRAAEALEKGTAGEADPVQAKRFRKIALTHLVRECEAGDPHACFIMADKYRSGAELKASPVRAEALEKRGVELCRLRPAPECPAR